jgi:outer membrane protein assembly factor BamB/tRNA A-37 threonylcarbamoyl transferase component Bud32
MTSAGQRPNQPPPSPEPPPTGPFQPKEAASELVRVLDQYLADLQAGRAPERSQLLAAHPELAAPLEQCLAGIEFIHHAARLSPETPARIGDFRIVREIGRGGMGVVYEAEQVSLKRTVALKVLRFGAVADAEVMQRFQREAETVARLHHTNIVPVFAVGCEHGVHYYAMQFIDGRSLAAVIEEHGRQGMPARPADIARWGLQAAEALAHAHQRGVIHRDIKPSNLLLDPEGVVWLTDFGLARRVDEVVLTATGVLMGTPRYMSPEQAGGFKQPVDHRTDIYSLGATLYELATGKPLFEAGTPHAVITQILNAEPVRPRRLQGDLPHDLETIILKCLAKDAAGRYASAQHLADDLRAFLDGRPIKARQARWPERAWRWAKKRRRSLALTAVTAVVAALLALGSLSAWRSYQEHQLGRLLLTTDGPYLRAEVLNERDEAVVPAFTVPAQEWVVLAPGSYRVRLSCPGLLSETLQVDIERGAKHQFKVDLEARQLWEPLAESHGDRVVAVDLGGRIDFVRLSDNQSVLSRVDGRTGKVVWKKPRHVKPKGPGKGLTDEEWQQRETILAENWPGDLPLLQVAPDLDGDGVGDLVWFSQNKAALWALSGRDGKELWWYHGGPGKIVAAPAVIDVDGDGTPDLIATMTAGKQRGIEAISGRTGKPLWRFLLEDGWFPEAAATPFAAEVARIGGRPVVVCQAGSRLIGLDPATGKPVQAARDLGFTPLRAPQLVDGPEPLVLLLREVGSQTLELSALAWTTGGLVWKKSLRAEWPGSRKKASAWDSGIPALPPAWPLVADLDGDGRPVVIVANKPARNTPEPEQKPDTIYLDLDERSTDWAALEVLDAATGALRWQRRLRGSAPKGMFQLEQFVVGPAVDGNGRRDLFVASFAQPRREDPGEGNYTHHDLYVTALSGRDGQTLWWWREHLRLGDEDRLEPLQWWQTGPDGRPELLVSYNSDLSHSSPKSPSATFALVAGTGRLAHVLPEVARPGVADLNGDGNPALYFVHQSQQKKASGEPRSTRLVALKGTFAEAWRRLGNWTPIQDVDGDGVPDLLRQDKDTKTTAAISGTDGHVLWRSPVAGDFTAPPLPQGDLDGDGVPDLLTKSSLGRLAISGKTGCLLWPPQPLKPEHPSYQDKDLKTEDCVGMGHFTPALPEATCLPLTRDRKPVVVYVYTLDFGSNLLSELGERQSQLWIAAVEGATGRVIWKQPLSEKGSQYGYSLKILATTDLDGDGQPDLLVLVGLPDRPWELRALRGDDGLGLWRRSLAAPPLFLPLGGGRMSLPVLVGDLMGAGTPQIVVVDRVCTPADGAVREGKKLWIGRSHFQVQALAGKDGNPLWTWRGEELEPMTVPERIPWQANAVLANLEGIGPAVCLHLGQYHPDHLAQPHPEDLTSWQLVLDANGRQRQRREARLAPPGSWLHQGDLRLGNLFAFDSDGDGHQKLLWFSPHGADQGDLRAFRGGFDQLGWAAQLPTAYCRDIRVLGTGFPATVAATGLYSGDTYGLDGSTGKLRWRIVGKHQLLDSSSAGEAPRFITQEAESTACFVIPPAGRPAALGASLAPPTAPSDPRLAMPLPWVDAVMRQFFLVSIGIALALLGVPGLLLWVTIRRRSWRWGLVLVAYLGATGYAYAADWIPQNLSSFGELFFVVPILHAVDAVLGLLHQVLPIRVDIRWLRALLGLPALVFLQVLLLWLLRWHWRRLGWLLVAVLLVTPLAGGVILLLDDPKYDPAQYYSWTGWYWLGPVGMYFTGVMILVLVFLGQLVRMLRWGVRRLSPR